MRKRSHSIWSASRDIGKASRGNRQSRQRALRASKKNVRACFLVTSLPSVRHAFPKSPRKRLFSVANDIKMNEGTYTRSLMHLHTHTRAPANYGKAAAWNRWWATAKRTQLRCHTRTLSCRHNEWDNCAAMTRDDKKDTNSQAHSYRETHTHAHISEWAAKMNNDLGSVAIKCFISYLSSK